MFFIHVTEISNNYLKPSPTNFSKIWPTSWPGTSTRDPRSTAAWSAQAVRQASGSVEDRLLVAQTTRCMATQRECIFAIAHSREWSSATTRDRRSDDGVLQLFSGSCNKLLLFVFCLFTNCSRWDTRLRAEAGSLTEAWSTNFTLWVKKWPLYFCLYLSQILSDFQIFSALN
jgi:hypothetical protein